MPHSGFTMSKKDKFQHVRLRPEIAARIAKMRRREPYWGSVATVLNRAAAIGLDKLEKLTEVEP